MSDLFAIDAAFKYEQMGEMKVIGIVVDRMGEECAWLADMKPRGFARGFLGSGPIKMPKIREFDSVPTMCLWRTILKSDGKDMKNNLFKEIL